MKTKKKNQKGFTLLELLMSTFIFIFITTIVLINFGAIKRSDELRIGAQILASEIRKAQNMTQTGVVTEGVTSYGINFESESYVLFADSDPERNKVFDEEIDRQISSVIFKNVTIDREGYNVTFIPPKPIICIGETEMECNLEGNFVITLTHIITGETREVVVQPLSGQISIQKPEI